MRLLYFSPVPWNWIKQRPHFISEEFARIPGVQVDFVSLEPRQLHHGKLIEKKKVGSDIETINFSTFPFSLNFSLIEKFNSFFVRSYLKQNSYDVQIITDPRQFFFLPHREKITFFDCMDDIPSFYNGRKRYKKLQEERVVLPLIRGVIASSNYLRSKLADRNPDLHLKIEVIKNALSTDYLSRAKGKCNLRLQSPSVLYVGTIDSWFDFEALEQLLNCLPNSNFYLIGPVNTDIPNKLKRKNILLTGAVPHDYVRSLCEQADLLILPFKVNELVRSVNPVKLYEYIASGKPIISSYWDELSDFCRCGNVYFYNEIAELTESFVESVISSGSQRPSSSFIEQNCWRQRANRFNEIIARELLNE